MTLRNQLFYLLAIICLSLCMRALAQSAPPPIPQQEQPEVLTSGPVHEAYAEPVNIEAEQGLTAPTAPPADIQETPPNERPEGNYVWVPGYWSWDQQRNDYTWVSGCWRVSPPNMNWMPGYWSQAGAGWEWIPGFWSTDETQELEYLPAPPPLENIEAPANPPSPDVTWVPPCYYWNQTQYTLRQGYWLESHPGWVWTASYNQWTPHGYIMCDGHWDYPMENRGVLFAPVNFPHSVYARADFAYSPSTVIDVSLLSGNLFVSPRYSHYYFGDYYDDTYISVGIYPWFDRTHIRGWYDPIFEYDRVAYRSRDPHWEENERRNFDQRRDNRDLRPPRTFNEMETRLAKAPEAQRKNIQVAQSLKMVVNNKTTNIKFTQINVDARRQVVKQATDVTQLRDQRNQWETKATARPAAAPARTEVEPARNERATPPAARREAEPAPDERPAPAAPPSAERRQAAPAPEARPTAPPAARAEARPQPREVRITQPERVRVPTTPASGRPAAAASVDRSPPERPADERRGRPEGRGGEQKKD